MPLFLYGWKSSYFFTFCFFHFCLLVLSKSPFTTLTTQYLAEDLPSGFPETVGHRILFLNVNEILASCLSDLLLCNLPPLHCYHYLLQFPSGTSWLYSTTTSIWTPRDPILSAVSIWAHTYDFFFFFTFVYFFILVGTVHTIYCTRYS